MQARSAEAKPAPKGLVILAFAAVYLIWGSTYFFIRLAVHDIPPFILGALRFLCSGAIMLGWCVVTRQQIWSPKLLRKAAVSGIFMLFIGTGVVIWVEQYLESALVAILVSAAPLWFVFLDRRNWTRNFSNAAIVTGLLIGFAGVILLFYEKITGTLAKVNDTTGILSLFLLLLGSMGWAWGSLYSKYHGSAASTQVLTGWQMLISGLTFLVIVPFTDEPSSFHPGDVSWSSWMSVAYLVLFGSIAGFSAYVWLLKVRSAAQVSTYGYVNPVVAVLLGVLFAAEKVTLMQITGLVIILGSVLLINRAKES